MAGDDPPYLNVGTDVSAKYRGAFCEAKVKKLVRCVKCKIYLKDTQSSIIVTDENVKGNLKTGAVVELKHPETNQNVEGTITRLTDSSMYTVVFNDGDEKTLRRTQLCLKGEKHFIESETLDNLPLSHPEHFGTPVMHDKKMKRGRHSTGNDDDTEDASSDESLPKRAEYKGRLQQLVGKVMMMEMADKRKTQVPVLIVLPDAHSMDLKTKDHLMVKSFKDSKFYSVLRKDLKEFSKELGQKNEDKGLKAAFEKALAYYENQDLPGSWERDELLGTDDEEMSEDDESSDEEQCEEKDRFVAQLYKFMDDRGTPINKGPYIGNKDLNLYRLFKVVQNLGGYNKVTNQMKWKGVYTKMNIPPSSFAYDQIKNAYKKYLHAFEDFYRKLGSTMGTISRPGRSRNNSGRGVVAFKKDRFQDKCDDKESDDQKDDEEDSGKSNDETPSKRERSPQKRVMRHDLIPKEEKSKKEEPAKEKKDEEETPKKSTKKEITAKKDDSAKKQAKPTVKKEDERKATKKDNEESKKASKKDSDDEKEKDDKTQQQKKVVRRRSMRKDEKDEEMKEEEKEEVKKEKPIEKDTSKSKNKVTTVAVKEEKKEKKEDKEKPKLTRKDSKKVQKSDEEDMDTEKSKTSLKREVKKMRGEDDSDVVEKPKGKESSAQKKDVKKEEPEVAESKPSSAKKENKAKVDREKPKIEDEDTDSKGSEEFQKETDTSSKVNAQYPNGTKLQVRYGRGRNQKVYDAKIVEAGLDGSQVQYLVHYAGWNNRYDEWIKPERIVNVIPKPEADRNKRSKESSPKISKPPQIVGKKRGRPGMTPPHPSTSGTGTAVKPTSQSGDICSPPVLIKSAKSPQSTSKQNKSRPTRSNSVEVKMMDGLPPKMRRTRKSSGVTESSDVNSQGSDMDESYHTDDDADSKGEFSPGHPDLDEEDMSVEYEDNTEDLDSDSGAAEMPHLDSRADQEDKLQILKADEEEKMDKNKMDSKHIDTPEEIIDVRVETSVTEEKPVEKDTENAPKLVAIKSNHPGLDIEDKSLPDMQETREKQKEVFKWDLDEEEDESSNKTCKFVTEILDSIQSESDISEVTDGDLPPVIAPVLEKCDKEEFTSSPHVDKPAPEIKPEIKPDKVPAQLPLVDDRFEFRDEEEEITLPDLRAEAEKELKERQKLEADLIEKKIQKGKKKEPKEKKEMREKKEVKKGKMTMAERKLVILPEGVNDINFEPPLKKSKEEKLEELPSESVSIMSSVDEAISSVCDKARQMAMEENETEKKKVKKKVKKKGETGELGEGKKDTGKTSKTPKGDKVTAKSKMKKNKDTNEVEKCEEQLLDSATGLLMKSDTKLDSDSPPVLSSAVLDSSSNKNKPVIKYDSAIDIQAPVLSGVELLSGVAIMKESESTLDQKNESSATMESAIITNTVLDNTPPTTPEHDSTDSAPCPSQEHSSHEVLKVSEISNEHDQQFVGESPTGNASPSSNDGSVGSGNVACSESSNTDVPVSTNLGKRRRESDEATPKKKRKGKSKGISERKSKQTTAPTVGSDSDETGAERRCSPPLGSTSPSKHTSSSSTNSPRPSKYNLNLEEGKYLEGERRIAFLMEKIQEIRKIYMNVKSEVACIDRRRKRARRKERERDCVQSSSTAAENDCSR